MRKGFYSKLAFSNIEKNSQTYLPYILTCIGTIAMFYIMHFITINDGLKDVYGGAQLKVILAFGCIVIGIFAAIFLFYTNSFLIKRRKKELGLYNILGLGKWNLAKMLLYENIDIAIFTITTGVLLGIIGSKLMFVLLLRMLDFSIPLGFSVSWMSVLWTVGIFLVIYFLILVSNFFKIRKVNPIELLHGSAHGEKEPKTKWPLVVIGILALGGGYFIALWVESPMDAISLFFLAVLLVMIGTYCLFTAGSIALLKLLRRKKSYYYTTKHFISVSGMLYRMKQNAVGLGNICILCTMVLVMVSGTVSLYLGQEDAIKTYYPYDIRIAEDDVPKESRLELLNIANEEIKKSGLTYSLLEDNGYFSAVTRHQSNEFSGKDVTSYSSGVCIFYAITTEEYQRLTGESLSLSENEVYLGIENMVYTNSDIVVFGQTYAVKGYVQGFSINGSNASLAIDSVYMIVKDAAVLDRLYFDGEDSGGIASGYSSSVGFNLDCSKEEKLALYEQIRKRVTDAGMDSVDVECREANRDQFLTLDGGLLFVGMFLGVLFLMATVLNIYYKQVSEGYDDKERFRIMQNVGMSLKEIRSSIKNQILIVFFIPLVTAVIHIAFAFKVITKLLALLGLINVPLFLVCTLVTIAVFAVIYIIVYSLTARSYYKIVK